MIELLIDNLEIAAAELKKSLESTPHRPSLSSLRNFQRYCETRIELTKNTTEIFLCISFSNMIEYFFTNLAGDIPYYPEIHQIRASLVSKIPEGLEKVAKALRTQNDKDLLLELASLYSEIVESVLHLNKGIVYGA
jgi:hypothetical protein